MSESQRNEDVVGVLKEMSGTLHEVLESTRALEISHDEHNEQHQYLKGLINRDREKREFYAELRKHMAKAGILGLLSGLAALTILGIESYLKSKGV